MNLSIVLRTYIFRICTVLLILGLDLGTKRNCSVNLVQNYKDLFFVESNVIHRSTKNNTSITYLCIFQKQIWNFI